MREVLTVCLGEDGHFVDGEADGLAALERFRKTPWDIVLTDRAMPKMNGDQLAVEIKKLDPAMPVVMITGFGDLMRDVGDQPPGVDAVVRKPFTMETLREGMNKAMALHEGVMVKAGVPAAEGVPSLVSGTFH